MASIQQYSETILNFALRTWGGGLGLTNSVEAASTDAYELTKKGWSCVNPHDLPWNIKTRTLPDSAAAQIVSDQLPKPHTIMFQGGMYGDDPDDYMVRLGALKTALFDINTSRDWSCLRIGLYDGATQTWSRLYGVPGTILSPMRPKTLLYAPASLSMEFHVTDPYWYVDTETVQAITITAGTGNTGVFAVQHPTQRAILKITKDGAGNPTNPVITNAAGETFYIYGGLPNVNDYWLADFHAGKLWKSLSGTVTDVTGTNAGGQWLTLDGFETVTVTDGGSAAYVAALTWMDRVW